MKKSLATVTGAGRAGLVTCLVTGWLVTGCGGDGATPGALQAVLDEPRPTAVDRFEVWVCDVPLGVDDPLYAVDAERVPLTAQDVVDQVADGVGAYFSTVSHGQYRPVFVAGGTVRIDEDDASQACIDRALDASSATADAVLVVATAQHAADQPGGRATPGARDVDGPASATGRSVYVGANDFHPTALHPIALDLLQHEIGHSLGLPHSGDAVGASGNRAVGPYDLMADPASPRLVDPARRDGPDLLLIGRVALGWTSLDDVLVVPRGDLPEGDGTPVMLLPSTSPPTGPTRTRGAIVTIDEHRLLTIELLPATGFDDHLAAAGVVVHLVDDRPEQCGAAERCTGVDRVQQVVAADDGTTSATTGTVLTVADVVVTVVETSNDGATVALSAA